MIKTLLIRLIRFYQKHLSKKACPYTPSCSEYTIRALHIHGLIIGVFLGMWRIIRCNPFIKGRYDPVPENFFKRRWVI